MKKILCLLLALGLLSGCGLQPPAPTEPVATAPAATEPAETIPQEIKAAETTEPAPTEPAHSALYLESVPVEDVIVWFQEVVLDTEYWGGGDPTRVQKWAEPICYCVEGEMAEEDLLILENFASWLNAVEGFPGMKQAEAGDWVNLRIHFTDGQGMMDILGEDYVGMDGAVTYWYDGENQIYDADICVLQHLEGDLRRSVILEEIYNGLGPVQDTTLRPDSIIYQDYAMPQALTREDELILKLLYHPDMLCGMDAAQCEAVIRRLYY